VATVSSRFELTVGSHIPLLAKEGLARIIHDFLGEVRKGEEFHTEITELRHRERGEAPAIFSVHSVVQEFDHSTRNSL
jgi:hypothetical protein